MSRRLVTLGAALLLGLVCLAVPALADETACHARVVLLGGESLKMQDFGVNLTQDSDAGYEMMVSFDQDKAIIDIRDLRSITRLAPPKKVGSGDMVTFAFVGRKGKKGQFKVDGGYYMSGKFSLGDRSITAGEVKHIVFDCVPLN
ncbi:MAG: hypothetical protein K9K66_17655 [Desulfarculaceae bacterium]|nr:hypothetical protein [Desulfarculaceae bacterium]MCF8073403.1 hypothetical protein [Desulfarculaceae bacterium]MCF8103487.1 hypothetical protein [Desulfarculaceae bacterium]MCF8115814.1 hypothetical protein [Desulfarculaceae bacterium]